MKSSSSLLLESYRVAHYYRRPIAGIMLGLVVIALAAALIKAAVSPVYEASTKMTMLPQRSEIEYAARSMAVAPVSPAYYLSQTHTEFLMSRTLAREVLEKLDGSTNRVEENESGIVAAVKKVVITPVQSVMVRTKAFMAHGRMATSDPEQQAVNNLLRRVQVRQVPGSFVLELTVRSSDPDEAAQTANLIADQCIEQTLKANQEEMRVMREYLDEEIARTELDLKIIERALLDFKEENNFYIGEVDVSLRLKELSDYLREYSDTIVDMEQIQTRITELSPHRSPGSMVAIKADRESFVTKKKNLEKIIREKTEVLDAFPKNERTYLRLIRDRAHKEAALAELRMNILKTKAAEASKLSALRIIDYAVPPTYPSEPNILASLAAALVLGFVVSGGYIAGRESWNRHVRNGRDLEALDRPFWGPVPYVPGWAAGSVRRGDGGLLNWMGTRSLAVLFRLSGRGSVSRWYGHMYRVHIEHLFERWMEEAAGGITLLVSEDAGAGKSFLAVQLAQRAAAGGRKIMLVDANMLSPNLHETLNVPLNTGLSDYLAGRAEITQVIQRADNGMDFISAGACGDDIGGVWHAERAETLKTYLKEHYDMVLAESAALKENPHSAAAWRWSDVLMLVFDADDTTEQTLQDIRRRLDVYKGKAGTVLNRVRFRGDFLFQSGPKR